jgi:hypothetical protein
MMTKTLRHDASTGELRLVYTDLWNGQHERTEYRVTGEREGGRPVRNRPELDGTPVLGTVPGLYIRLTSVDDRRARGSALPRAQVTKQYVGSAGQYDNDTVRMLLTNRQGGKHT